MVSEAQNRANKKWKAANKEKQAIYNMRSAAKRFIKVADLDDLNEFAILIAQRQNELKNKR
jgi:hypothetical protein